MSAEREENRTTVGFFDPDENPDGLFETGFPDPGPRYVYHPPTRMRRIRRSIVGWFTSPRMEAWHLWRRIYVPIKNAQIARWYRRNPGKLLGVNGWVGTVEDLREIAERKGPPPENPGPPPKLVSPLVRSSG